MKYKIFKYKLEITGNIQTLELPCGFKIIKLGLQNNVPHIWIQFKVEYEKVLNKYDFIMIGTGHTFYSKWIAMHLDSVFIDEFVWHFYYLGINENEN